jgi:hypothetical protein
MIAVMAVLSMLLWLAAVVLERSHCWCRGDRPERTDPVVAEKCRLESILVGRLLSGALQPEAYHRAMADLAMADAARKPIEIPHRHRG